MEEQEFIKNCIVAESENYFFVLYLRNELCTGRYRIPKKDAKTKEDAIKEAFEWSLDIN